MVKNKSKCREAELEIFDIRYLCNPKKMDAEIYIMFYLLNII